MTVAILVAVAILALLVVSLYRYVHARFENLVDRLSRIEDALGADEWVELLRSVPSILGEHPEQVEKDGVVGRLERIEAALDPMVRARLHVKRRLRQLDRMLEEDPGIAYAHWQATQIEELIEQGQRPDRTDWESWIRTPFPWA